MTPPGPAFVRYVQSMYLLRDVASLHLNGRAYHCLTSAGIDTVLDLCQHTASDLVKIKGLGRLTLKHIRARLAERGLALRPHASDAWL